MSWGVFHNTVLRIAEGLWVQIRRRLHNSQDGYQLEANAVKNINDWHRGMVH